MSAVFSYSALKRAVFISYPMKISLFNLYSFSGRKSYNMANHFSSDIGAPHRLKPIMIYKSNRPCFIYCSGLVFPFLFYQLWMSYIRNSLWVFETLTCTLITSIQVMQLKLALKHHTKLSHKSGDINLIFKNVFNQKKTVCSLKSW